MPKNHLCCQLLLQEFQILIRPQPFRMITRKPALGPHYIKVFMDDAVISGKNPSTANLKINHHNHQAWGVSGRVPDSNARC